MRTVSEIENEMEDIRQGLLVALQTPNALELVDIMYLAQRVNDLKQELRIAKANEF